MVTPSIHNHSLQRAPARTLLSDFKAKKNAVQQINMKVYRLVESHLNTYFNGQVTRFNDPINRPSLTDRLVRELKKNCSTREYYSFINPILISKMAFAHYLSIASEAFNK